MPRIHSSPLCTVKPALETVLEDVAFAGWIRYYVNVFWEKAPDRRTSRTLDWLNDACEAKLHEKDRHHGEVTYRALMSPVSITASSAFDWQQHPFTQANRARLRPGKKKYTGKCPISLLLTELNTTHVDGKAQRVPPYVLLGTKRWFGRRAAVSKYNLDEIAFDAARRAADTCHDQAKPVTDGFPCKIRISTFTIDVMFATKFEADILREFLESKSEPKSESAAAKSDS